MRSTISILAGAVLAAMGVQASAQPYPAKSLRLVAPFVPGGATDVIARIIAQRLTTALGQSVVVENRPGAGGNIAAEYVARSAPDGYTLLTAFPGLAINPSLYTNMSYNPQTDLAPVVLMSETPLLLAVHPSLPARTVKELIALAKRRPSELSFPSAGNGTSSHLGAELFRNMAGIAVLHVPYKGAAQGLLDLVAGRMSFMINPLPEMLPYTQPGRIRALATTGKERSAAASELPTIGEAALPGYEMGAWNGIMVAPGTSREIIVRLNAEVTKVLRLPDVRDQLSGLGYVILAGSPDQFSAHLKSETEKWARVIKASGIKLE